MKTNTYKKLSMSIKKSVEKYECRQQTHFNNLVNGAFLDFISFMFLLISDDCSESIQLNIRST